MIGGLLEALAGWVTFIVISAAIIGLSLLIDS
jgi:hypothetical protein